MSEQEWKATFEAEIPTAPKLLDADPGAAYCAHRNGIEYVEVTQPAGSVYHWWRCSVCLCEFRPTGRPRERAERETWG